MLGLARVADDVGPTVTAVGTPAEENGSGKILLLERGAFAGVHAAMMVHPAPLDVVEPATLAFQQFDVHIPSTHPTIGVDSFPAVNHQPEFAAHCATPAADGAVRDGAAAMAWTAIDVATDGALSARLRARY